jgi:hypothetical protein
VAAALEELGGTVVDLRILGCYPSAIVVEKTGAAKN